MSARQATAADQWNASASEAVQLPSGNMAVLRKRMNLWVLVRRGLAGQEMLDAFAKAADGVLEDLDMAVALNDAIVQEMFVEPRVFVPSEEEPEPPDGEVHVDDIDDADIEFVIERAFRGAREAAAFRDQQRGATSGSDGASVGGDAERSGGPRGRRGGRVPVGQAAGGKARGGAAGKRTKS